MPDSLPAGPEDLAADLVAASTNFQSWTGTASEAAARERVYVGEYEGDRYPFVVISPAQDESYEIASGPYPMGSLAVDFHAKTAVADASNPAAATHGFQNWVRAIVQDMQTLGGGPSGGRLLTRGVRVEVPPQRSSRKDVADEWFARYVIEYGASR